MGLHSQLLRGDPRLEACLVNDSAHIKQGAVGGHVSRIQTALSVLDGVELDGDELSTSTYGPDTAAAVLSYKTKRNIINRRYETQADDIVGKLTIASLDREMFQQENGPPPPQPPPEATAPPIFPPRPLPPHQYVLGTLRTWPGYGFLKDYGPPVLNAGEAKELNLAARRILNKYYPRYPIGTILPVNITTILRRNVSFRDYLFIFDWHPLDPKNPVWHPSISALAPDALAVLKLVGRWFVKFDTEWSWFYKFRNDGFVSATDVHDPPEQFWLGTWHFVGKSIKILWGGAGNEEWFLPLDPKGQRGQSLVGQGGLSAEKLKK